MADETVANQRPAVIVAVIVAALAAAGLWYFFVFRPLETDKIAADIPTPTPIPSISETPVPLTDALSDVNTTTNTPASTPPLPAEAPTEAAYVEPTAPTGGEDYAVLMAFLAMIAGLWGLVRMSRTEVLAT